MDAATRRRPAAIVVLLLGAALGLLAGMVWAVVTPPSYTASSRVFVATRQAAVPELQADGARVDELAGSFISVATSAYVLEGVAADLGLRGGSADLAGRITVERPAGTAVLDIRATDPSAEQAAAVANAVATRLVAAGTQLAPATGSEQAEITVIQRAAAGTASARPEMLRSLLVGLAGGTGAGALALVVGSIRRRRAVPALLQ